MQIETIEELADILGASTLNRLELETEGFSLQMERAAPVAVVPPPVPPLASVGEAVPTDEEAPAAEGAVRVEAPIVGVFHEASAPVTEGQEVRAGDILGTIEALALRNEIRSPMDGPVVAVFVEDGQPVEYGQPLFAIGRPEGAA